MRPAEFTQEQIIEAGQELQAAGRNITGFALRQKVGGGNPSRLKQVWDEHVSSQSVTHAEPVAELPVEVAEEVAAVTKALTERLASLAVELNDKAVKAAERRVAEVIRAAGEQREQAERELADASVTVEDLEGAVETCARAQDGRSSDAAARQTAEMGRALMAGCCRSSGPAAGRFPGPGPSPGCGAGPGARALVTSREVCRGRGGGARRCPGRSEARR